MNPYLLLAGLIAFAAAVGGAYWQGRQDGADHCIAEQVRDEAVAAIAGDAAASAAAKAISQLEVKHVTVRQTLEREVLTKEVFRDCRSGPDAVRLFNATLPGADQPASAPGRGDVPAADPAR
jgi:hypothetical protein